MTSPVGHALGGLIASRWPATSGQQSTQYGIDWRCLVFVIFAANAPDLDFLPGIAIGSFSAFHHGPTHSLLAVLIFAVVVYGFTRIVKAQNRWFWVLMGSLAYASHLLLDLITTDEVLPYGMQLFWPFSEQYVIAPVSLFIDIHHGGVAEDFWASLPQIFSRHNLIAIGFELMVLLPILWLRNYFFQSADN